MSKVLSFNNFKTSAKQLESFVGHVCLVEYYHNDVSSEPTVSILNKIEDVYYGEDESERHISIRFSEGTDLSFSNEAYETNLSNGVVVFGSKHDDETYCLIEKQ